MTISIKIKRNPSVIPQRRIGRVDKKYVNQ